MVIRLPISRCFSLVLLLFCCLPVFSQQELADSLKRVMGFSNDTTRVGMLLKLSEAYMKFSPKKAVDPANEAAILAVQLGNDTLEAKSLTMIGRVNYKIGNFTLAISNLEKAEKLYLQLGLDRSAGLVAITMANCYHDKGNYNESLHHSFEAYKIFENAGDKSGMSGALIASGNVYRMIKNYNKAIADYEKALALSKEGGDLKNQASSLNNLSNAYGDKGDNEKAIAYLEESRKIYEKLDDKFNLAKVLNNIGSVYDDTKRFDLATDYYLQSLEIRKQIGDKRGMATSLANLGKVALEEDKPDKAVDYLNRSLELARKAGALDLQMQILEYLSDSYVKLHDPEKALEFYTQFSSLKDSVFNENLSESIAEMQARFDVEKAESETRAQQKEKKLITISAIVGGILLLIIIVIIWNRAVARKKTNIRLNQQKQEIEQKNAALNDAYSEIERKNKDITDSILYASRIQGAILPEVEFAKTFGPKGFVLYIPKDIVSGDFYWMEQTEDHILFAAVDCTGHGVPGAFVSIVCSNLLSQAVKEHGLVHPEEILDDVNGRLSQTLRQRQDESRVRDGMDIALCVINRKTLLMEYAGAFNPAWIFRNGKSEELQPDKFPVGHYVEDILRPFTRKQYQLQPGDRVYVFSDGYSDQFGGEFGKKYKRSSFLDFVTRIQNQPFIRHRELLEKEHYDWKRQNDQIDDILILGVEL
jgi:tetratricopeptide (TPR) repeat protein